MGYYMKQWSLLNGILWKRYLRRNRVWIALFLVAGILFLCMGGKSLQEDGYSGIRTGIFAEDEAGERLFARMQEEEGIFRFFLYHNEEEMLRQIKNGSLECGFALPAGFYENLEQGRMMRQIVLYYSPASSAHKLSYEVVFGYLFEMLSDEVLMDYAEYAGEAGIFGGEGTASEESLEYIREELLTKNEYYRQNGSTFSFRFEQIGKEEQQEMAALNTGKGCIAVMVFLMSLLGLADSYESGAMLRGLTGDRQRKVRESVLNISILGSVILGGLLLLLSGTGEGWGREIAGLAFYFVILEIYIRLLRMIVKTPEAVYGLMPVLILGSLLFCPVFIQIKAYLPIAELAEKLFPVSYYLNLP